MNLAKPFLWLIDRYRRSVLRKNLPVECNFEPSCSAYSRKAFKRHGVWKGMSLTVRRLRRCNKPDAIEKLHDPVP